MKPVLRMLLGCGLPFLAIFVLPLFGVDGGVVFTVFIVLFFVGHLLICGRHGEHGDGHDSEKGGDHGSCH